MSIEKLPKVTIWTDGACSTTFIDNKPESKISFGGWGAVLSCGTDKLFLSGSELNGSNNRMELKAVVEALTQLTRSCTIYLFTDSQYVLTGIRSLSSWKSAGWITKSGTEVKNQDLWKDYEALAKKHRIMPLWVKGHNGTPMNELCDRLAVNARLKLAKENGVSTKSPGSSTRVIAEPHIKRMRLEPRFSINPHLSTRSKLKQLFEQKRKFRKELSQEYKERRQNLFKKYKQKRKSIMLF